MKRNQQVNICLRPDDIVPLSCSRISKIRVSSLTLSEFEGNKLSVEKIPLT